MALTSASIALAVVAGWLGVRQVASARDEVASARSELVLATAAAETARRDHEAVVAERDAAREQRTSAQATAERERRELARKKPTDQTAAKADEDRARLDEALVAMQLTKSFLLSAERAAAEGGAIQKKQFRAALDEAARLLEHHDVKRGSVMQPEMNIFVGELLVQHGPVGAAGPLFERAVPAGTGMLTPGQQLEAGVGAARARLWSGDAAGARAALKALPAASAEPTIAQRLALAEVRAEAARRLELVSEARSALSERVELARQVARDNPEALHAAAHALAAHHLAYGRFEDAEALLREQLARDEAQKAPKAAFLTRMALAWALLERGRLDEGGRLDEEIRATLSAEPVVPDVLAEPLVSDYLVARRRWALAERSLDAQWRRSADAVVSPADRERIAAQLVHVFESSDQAELAATWRRTLSQLQAARSVPGGTP